MPPLAAQRVVRFVGAAVGADPVVEGAGHTAKRRAATCPAPQPADGARVSPCPQAVWLVFPRSQPGARFAIESLAGDRTDAKVSKQRYAFSRIAAESLARDRPDKQLAAQG